MRSPETSKVFGRIHSHTFSRGAKQYGLPRVLHAEASVCYHEFGDPVLRGRRSGHLGKEGVATGRRDGSPLSMMFVSEILKESPHGFDRAGSFFVGLRAGGRLRNEPHRRFTDSLPISSPRFRRRLSRYRRFCARPRSFPSNPSSERKSLPSSLRESCRRRTCARRSTLRAP